MAADPAISERIYQELRRRLLAGDFKLRERLDVGRIAARMHASATPVREALTRLASERLIEARPARGFFAVLWSRAELETLYEWRMELAAIAVRSVDGGPVAATSPQAGYPERVADFFRGLERGANAELRRAAANADDRLYAARRAEPDVLGDCEEELSLLQRELETGAQSALMSLLRQFHQRRIFHVAAIRERALLRALPGNGE